MTAIRRRSDYIIGFIATAIGPNKSRKPARLIALAHNKRGKVWMKNNIHGFTADNCLSVKPCMFVFYSNFAAYIVCRRHKPCEFLWFVWTDCWGNKSYYIITSPANIKPTARGNPRISISYHGNVTPCLMHIGTPPYTNSSWLPKTSRNRLVNIDEPHMTRYDLIFSVAFASRLTIIYLHQQ